MEYFNREPTDHDSAIAGFGSISGLKKAEYFSREQVKCLGAGNSDPLKGYYFSKEHVHSQLTSLMSEEQLQTFAAKLRV